MFIVINTLLQSIFLCTKWFKKRKHPTKFSICGVKFYLYSSNYFTFLPGLEADHALHADEDRARDLLVEGAGLGTGDREAEGTKNLGDQGLTLEEEDQDLNRLKGEGLMKNPSQRGNSLQCLSYKVVLS